MKTTTDDGKRRCAWAGNKPFYVAYHDDEWGRPVRRDRGHFELLCLEGAQAGLSWETVLKKREHYRRVFHQFDIGRCAELEDSYLDTALLDPGIIRNRLKVYSVRDNAQAMLAVRQEFGSFNAYVWSYVDGEPLINRWRRMTEVPASTRISDALSKDLKKRGFKFVGSTIIYAYMQAAGLVCDHTMDCFRHPDNLAEK